MLVSQLVHYDSIKSIDWAGPSSTRFRRCDRPRFPPLPRNYINGLCHKSSQELALCDIQNNVKYQMPPHHIKDNINSFNNTNVFNTVADEMSGVLAWPSRPEYQLWLQDIRTPRVSKMGDWLLQTQQYRNWFGSIGRSESDGSALFFHGGPGVSKTYIRKKEKVLEGGRILLISCGVSSQVVDILWKQAIVENAAVACFYFDFAANEE